MDAILESVNLAFAVPIGAVLGLALLVFAYSIRGPVQPPSFDDLDSNDEQEKRKRNKKTKKPVSNGHLVESHGSPKSQVSPKVKKVTEKKSEEAVSPKTKAKKANKAVSSSKNEEAVTSSVVEDDSTGEWMTAMSKKERKIRSKYEAEVEKEAATEGAAKEMGHDSPQKVETVEERSPQPQHKKKDKKKKETLASELIKTKQADVPSENEKDLPPEVADMESVTMETNATLETKSPASTDVIDASDDNKDVVKPQNLNLPKIESDEAQLSPKSHRNQKKKRRKSVDQPQDNVTNSSTVAVSQSATDRSPIMSSQSEGQKNDSDVSVETESSSNGATGDSIDKAVPQSSESHDNSPAATVSGDVTFNELGGAWEDAKPQKKKKKPRREN